MNLQKMQIGKSAFKYYIHEPTLDYGLLEGVGTGQDMALIAGARKEGRCLQNIRGNTSNTNLCIFV